MYINDDAIINEAQTMWHAHNRLRESLLKNERQVEIALREIDGACKIASIRFAAAEIKSALAWGKRVQRWQDRFDMLMTENTKLTQEFYAIDSRSALLPCQCMFCTCTCDSDAYGVACPIHN